MSEEQERTLPPPEDGQASGEGHPQPLVTRREFLIGAGAGVAVTAAAAGAISVLSPPAAQPTAPVPKPAEPAVVPPPAAQPVSTRRVTLKINGLSHELEVQPHWTLLYVLREQLDLTGTKYGCDRGMCGMCTVVANGKNIYSCMNLTVHFNGAEILTVEGLAKGAKLHPIQEAFLKHKAFECAWCTPGFMMTAHAFLSTNPSPTLEQVKQAVAGNACRCGTYPQVFQAIMDASQMMRA